MVGPLPFALLIVPPLMVNVFVAFPSAEEVLMFRVPLFIVAAPVNVFVPSRVSVPLPVLVMPPAPVMALETVKEADPLPPSVVPPLFTFSAPELMVRGLLVLFW